MDFPRPAGNTSGTMTDHPFPDDAPAKPFWEQLLLEEPAWSLGPVAIGPRRSLLLEVRVHHDARVEVVRLDGKPLGDARERHRAAIDAAVNRLLAELRATRSERISRAVQPVTKRTARSQIRTPHPDELQAAELAKAEEAERQALRARALAEQSAFAERMERRRKEVESTRSFRRQPVPDAGTD